MKNKYISMNDLNDSKELLMYKTPKYIRLIILLLMIFLVSIITWIYFGKYEKVIIINGYVVNKETYDFKTPISGIVQEILVFDGDNIITGDELYVIKHDTLLQDIDLIKRDKISKENEINYIDSIYKLIESNKQTSLTKPNKSDYLKYYNIYQEYLNALSSNYIKRKYYKEVLTSYKSLDKSIERDNLVNEFNYRINDTYFELKSNKLFYLDKLYFYINSINKEIIQFDNEINYLNSSIDNYYVKTNDTGTITFNKNFKEGQYLYQGEAVLNITKDKDQVIKFYIENKDLNHVEINDLITIKYLEDTHNGKVTKINDKAIINENDGKQYIELLVNIDTNNYLTNNTIVEGIIKVDVKQYYQVLLEYLGVVN